MPKPILIAYASRCGATREVALEMEKVLNELGLKARALPYNEISDPSVYRAVILGSAVRYGRWLREATDFVNAHSRAINALPHALFSVHYLNLGSDKESTFKREAYTSTLRQTLTPRAEAFFPGKMDIDHLPLFEKLLSKAIRVQNGDLRDWARIRAWATEVGRGL